MGDKNKYEERTWYKSDEESLKEMEEDLVSRIHGPTSFNRLMDKIEIAQSRTLKRQKKMKIGRRAPQDILDELEQRYKDQQKSTSIHIGGSFFFKSPRNLKIGRGHGSDFVHIVFLNTLRHAKTKSEVLGPSFTWFGNNG